MLRAAVLMGMVMVFSWACTNSSGHQRQTQHPKIIDDPCHDSGYIHLLHRIDMRKAAFKLAYTHSPNRAMILDSCRNYLQTIMADSLFAYWEGTPWAFYGSTERPQCGDIACGYFVCTLLRDLGFDIPRVRWAQAASETFIREFCSNKVTHQINKTPEEVLEFLKHTKGSYYLVGLDTHVGIIENLSGEIHFLHSAEYVNAHGVTREPADGENPFYSSRYRVFGELFTDVQVTNWILDRRYP